MIKGKKMGKRILIISQAITQAYLDVLLDALKEEGIVDIITGSDVMGADNLYPSPSHDSTSLKSRLLCWWKHKKFIDKWLRECPKRYDMIFATSNPPINSYIGLKLKKKFNCPFIYMNWDLYPQVIYYMIGNPVAKVICKFWSLWNKLNYPNIDQMITLGDVVAKSIREECFRVAITVIPIPVNVDELRPIEKKLNPFAKKNGLDDKFVVLYSGKMGAGHNIQIILDAAKKLENNPNIKFVFIGNGQKYNCVENFIKENKSSNILLMPLQNREVFPYSMACGDIGIVSQEDKMAHLFMPSKTFSMMACGEAIIGICTEHDDLGNLIRENNIGEIITDGDSKRLSEIIEQLYYNTKLTNEYKVNSRNTALKFSINKIVEEYKKLFREVLNKDA